MDSRFIYPKSLFLSLGIMATFFAYSSSSKAQKNTDDNLRNRKNIQVVCEVGERDGDIYCYSQNYSGKFSSSFSRYLLTNSSDLNSVTQNRIASILQGRTFYNEILAHIVQNEANTYKSTVKIIEEMLELKYRDNPSLSNYMEILPPGTDAFISIVLVKTKDRVDYPRVSIDFIDPSHPQLMQAISIKDLYPIQTSIDEVQPTRYFGYIVVPFKPLLDPLPIVTINGSPIPQYNPAQPDAPSWKFMEEWEFGSKVIEIQGPNNFDRVENGEARTGYFFQLLNIYYQSGDTVNVDFKKAPIN